MTRKVLLDICKQHKLYRTAYLNDVLYLHYKGIKFNRCDYISLYIRLYNKLLWFVSELPEKDISNVWSSVGSILQ